METIGPRNEIDQLHNAIDSLFDRLEGDDDRFSLSSVLKDTLKPLLINLLGWWLALNSDRQKASLGLHVRPRWQSGGVPQARQLEDTLAGRILCLYRCHSSQVDRNDRRGDRIPRSHHTKV